MRHHGLQLARPPAVHGLFSKKAVMETPPGSWSLKLEVPQLQRGGHHANHFVKTCVPRLQRGVKTTKGTEIFGKKSANIAWQEPKTPRSFLPNSHLSPPLPQGADTGQGHHTHPRKTSPHQQGIRLSFASRSSRPKTSLPEVSPVPNGRFPSGLLNAGLLRFFKTLLGWVK